MKTIDDQKQFLSLKFLRGVTMWTSSLGVQYGRDSPTRVRFPAGTIKANNHQTVAGPRPANLV